MDVHGVSGWGGIKGVCVCVRLTVNSAEGCTLIGSGCTVWMGVCVDSEGVCVCVGGCVVGVWVGRW